MARYLTDRIGWAWPFYRSDDATLLFLRSLARLAEHDVSVLDRIVVQRDGRLRSLGACLTAALGFALSKAMNADGLIESARPARLAPEGGELAAYPVWQDSPDAAHRADGTLTTGPVAWAELQPIFSDGLTVLARLAECLPGLGLDRDQLRSAVALVRAFALKVLYMPGAGHFAFAAERVGDELVPLPVLKSNAGHLLGSELLADEGSADYIAALVTSLLEPSRGLVCPSGIRALSRTEVRSRPGAYHNGSVWPWDNPTIARGLNRHGFHRLGCWLDDTVLRVCGTLDTSPSTFAEVNPWCRRRTPKSSTSSVTIRIAATGRIA